MVSLIAGPNKQFAIDKGMPKAKQLLFGLAGKKFDKKAREKDVEYWFIFVRADGEQLKEISRIIEKNNIVPAIDPTTFRLADVNQALHLVAKGHPKGKCCFGWITVNELEIPPLLRSVKKNQKVE